VVIDDISYVRRSVLETSVLFELICQQLRLMLPADHIRPAIPRIGRDPSERIDPVEAMGRLVQHGEIIGIKS